MLETAKATATEAIGLMLETAKATASVFCMFRKCVLYASRYPIGPRVIISIEDFHFASRYPISPRGGFHFDSRNPTSPWCTGLGNSGSEMRLDVASTGGN